MVDFATVLVDTGEDSEVEAGSTGRVDADPRHTRSYVRLLLGGTVAHAEGCRVTLLISGEAQAKEVAATLRTAANILDASTEDGTTWRGALATTGVRVG